MSTVLDRFMSGYNFVPGTPPEQVATGQRLMKERLESTSTADSGSYYNNLSQLLETMNRTNSVSAYEAALAAARETNSFNAKQAELNRKFQQTSAERQMQFEASQAQKAMDFSRDMSNTTYQRAISDLKAAGLSPLLAYQNLQTSSPSGVSASGSSAGGSQASGVKPDTSSALDVDRKSLDRLLAMLTLNVNSALSIANVGTKLVGSILG